MRLALKMQYGGMLLTSLHQRTSRWLALHVPVIKHGAMMRRGHLDHPVGHSRGHHAEGLIHRVHSWLIHRPRSAHRLWMVILHLRCVHVRCGVRSDIWPGVRADRRVRGGRSRYTWVERWHRRQLGWSRRRRMWHGEAHRGRCGREGGRRRRRRMRRITARRPLVTMTVAVSVFVRLRRLVLLLLVLGRRARSQKLCLLCLRDLSDPAVVSLYKSEG